jgi:hypothetical protein
VNGVVAFARSFSGHRNSSPASQFVAKWSARGSAALNITGGNWTPIPNIARGAATVRENGARAIRATGSNTGRSILPPLSETANSRSSATESEGCAILQTTPQLSS